ncbi:MAG: trypsin-like peptidase domain-containing protein [Verrucomicrobia bacterium]|nr:trypsin-like peptidase domain-containing protein [Verrucomicrobiota bacterium]
MDVGYTVVGVPRVQVLEIVQDTQAAAAAPVKAQSSSSVEAPASGMFAEAPADTQESPVRELVGRLGEAVVQVRTPGGLGSGFFIHPDGYFVTNFHVIEGETRISVEVYHQKDGQLERRSYKEVRIVAMNKFADLALLKVEDKEAPRFKTVTLGTTEGLVQGDRVFAIGSPLGLERTVTEGIVSTTAREVGGDLYLQTTAQINPGNSGGPLFNARGSVVGVTNMKLTFGEGLGFAIPVAVLRYFLEHRDAYAYDNDNPSNAFRYLEPPSRLKLPLRGAGAPP